MEASTLLLLLSSVSATLLSTVRGDDITCSYMCAPQNQKMFMLQSRVYANIWEGPGHDWPERDERGWLTAGPDGITTAKYTGGEEQQLQWVQCSHDCCGPDGCDNTQTGLFLSTKFGTVTVGKKGVLELVPGPFAGPSMWGPEMDEHNVFGKWWKMEFASIEGSGTEFELKSVYEEYTPGKGFPYLLTEAATGKALRVGKKNKKVQMIKKYKPKKPTVQWEFEPL